MKIKFIGVPGEHHDSIHSYGYDFPLNKAVEVTDKGAIARLQNHPHFKSNPAEQIEDIDFREVPPSAPQNPVRLPDAYTQTYDDGRTESGYAPLPTEAEHEANVEAKEDATKETLMGQAKAKGIRTHGNWSVERLQAEIAKKS